MNKTKYIIIIIIALVAGAAALSLLNSPISIASNTFALDTFIEIKIYDKGAQKEQKIIDQANAGLDLIRELETTLSLYIDDSDTYNLMIYAGKEPVTVDDVTLKVINESFLYSDMTNGLFDITSGPLIELWAIDPPNGYVPTDEELSEALSLIDFNDISIKGNEVMLQNEGMIINLGAIAKGAIADEVKAQLIDNGVTSAIINLGGNVLTIGNKIDDSDFNVGIQDPFSDRNVYIMNIPVNDKAVVTSGDYERYFVEDGVTYHHILDTKTGYPADNNIKQVTIIAPDSLTADAMSTSVLLMGLDKGMSIIESIDGVDAIFVTHEKDIYITSGLKQSYTLNEEDAAGFTIVD